jgi:hypothetical protein
MVARCPRFASVFWTLTWAEEHSQQPHARFFLPHPCRPTGLGFDRFYPLPGQTYLQTGQSLAIVLNSLPSPVPEPASLLLVANGLLATAGVVCRKRRALAR